MSQLKKEKFLKYARACLVYILTLISLLLFFATIWLQSHINQINVPEIIFNLKTSQEGASKDLVLPAILGWVLPGVLIFLLGLYIIRKNKNARISLKTQFEKKIKEFTIISIPFIRKFAMLLSSLALVLSLSYSLDTLGFLNYIKSKRVESMFIEKNYVNPNKVSLKFPSKKRNLIYIYLESMEASDMDLAKGGALPKNVIPGLTKLAMDNTSFSNSSNMGGTIATTGATWTVGGMVAQSAGLPLLLSVSEDAIGPTTTFFPRTVAIGDILKKAGYTNEIMMGSDANFGGRRQLFQEHGDYKIWDLLTARATGKVPPDYYIWWGFEDSKLFDFAKEQITKLASQSKPFNFQMLTSDTHFQDGYPDAGYQDTFETQYKNVLNMSSNQIVSFVKWIQAQPFYKNTTIVISGDHPTMQDNFLNDIGNYQRVIYNCFINSAVKTKNTKNRTATTMDMFPSTLAALGVKISGNRLGLGTNLFSKEKTLAEKFGVLYINKQFSEDSSFYNQLLYPQKNN